MRRRWTIARPDPQAVRSIAEAARVSPLIATLLVNRGHTTPTAAGRFLSPRLQDLPSPFLMKGMPEAVDRILRAVREDEQIAVYGDYDVDGITSVSLLVHFFRQLGVPVRYFIPERFRDGYGLNAARLEELHAAGVGLVIAVDCGISGHEAVERARALGLDVVIVDHHQLPPVLPRAVAIINPLQADCQFPFKELAACGLTFFLLVALRNALRERGVFGRMAEPDLRTYLDLVGLGTIADMVPLLAENRTLAGRGLVELGRSQRPGLLALREVAGLTEAPITGGDVGFQLGPRLNAAGRIGEAVRAVELLLSSDFAQAQNLAFQIDQLNRRRREVEQQVLAEVIARIEEAGPPPDARDPIVLAADGWHPGVMGIVASKIVERYYRPAILIALQNGMGRGSARSVAGLDLFDSLSHCRDHLLGFGGHYFAAGITILRENVAALREQFTTVSRERLTGSAPEPQLDIDAEIPLASVDDALVADLEKLAPYGQANPEPTFLTRGVTVDAVRVVRDEHLILRLRHGDVGHAAIAFRMAAQRPDVGTAVDVVYRPEVDHWRGQASMRLRVVDLVRSA